MKAMLHALSFVLVCVLAYYMAVVVQREDNQSQGKRTKIPHRRQEAYKPAPARVEEPPVPLRDVEPAPERRADVPAEVPKVQEENQQPSSVPDEVKAPEPDPDTAAEVPKAPETTQPPSWPVKDEETAPKPDAEVPVEVLEAPEKAIREPHPLARGWGGDIDWVETYAEGLNKARISQKPLMVIHHMESCGVCKALKEAFSAHEEIQKMAKEEFIMFNLMHETNDPNLAPDGYYVPRILFVDPAMMIRTDITSKREQYRYSYTSNDLQMLLENMKKSKTPPKLH